MCTHETEEKKRMGPHKKLTHTLRTTKQSLLQTTNVNVVHDPHDLVTHDHIPPLSGTHKCFFKKKSPDYSGEEKELENNNQIIWQTTTPEALFPS